MNKDEREAFEKHFSNGDISLDRSGPDPDIYTDLTTHLMWEGWQARSTIDAELVEALKLCAAVCAGETMHKSGLVRALEKARAALAKHKGKD